MCEKLGKLCHSLKYRSGIHLTPLEFQFTVQPGPAAENSGIVGGAIVFSKYPRNISK